MDSCHLKKRQVGQEDPKIQRTSGNTGRRCTKWLGLVCSIHWTGILRVTRDSRQSSACDLRTSREGRTSKWCTISLHSHENRRRAKVIEITRIRVPSYLDLSTMTPPPKLMGQNSTCRGSTQKKFLRTLFTKINMWTTIRKGKWCGKRVQTGNVYSCTAKRFVSVRGCGRHF